MGGIVCPESLEGNAQPEERRWWWWCFVMGYFAVSLLRLKFSHQNVWLLNSVPWLAGGKASLLLPGNELCISVFLGVKKNPTNK